MQHEQEKSNQELIAKLKTFYIKLNYLHELFKDCIMFVTELPAMPFGARGPAKLIAWLFTL